MQIGFVQALNSSVGSLQYMWQYMDSADSKRMFGREAGFASIFGKASYRW